MIDFHTRASKWLIGTLVLTGILCQTGYAEQNPNHPTALELLDRYAHTRDQLESFIIKSDVSSVYSGVIWGGAFRADRKKKYSSVELRFDGDRTSHRSFDWGQRDSRTRFIPKQKASYCSYLWDGRTHFGCQVHPTKGNPIGHLRISRKFSREQIRQMISFEYCGHELLGFFIGEYDRVDSVLRKAADLSVKDRLQRLGGSDCYVIEALTKGGKYTIWLDPRHGYNIAKAIVHWSQDAPMYGKQNWRVKTALNSLENVRFKKIDALWVPVEADIVLNKTWHNGEWTRQSWHHKLTEITLNPDHDALGSFVPDDIKNGAVVHFLTPDGGLNLKEEKHTWQDGKVVDNDGRVVFDPGNDSLETADKRAGTAERTRPGIWELVRKYVVQRPAAANPLPPERVVHFPKDRTLGTVSVQDADMPRQRFGISGGQKETRVSFYRKKLYGTGAAVSGWSDCLEDVED